MRPEATHIVTIAAIAAGLPESAVMEVPDKETPMLPKKRLELDYLTEQYKVSGRIVGKRKTPGKETTHRTLDRKRYEVRLPVRVAVQSNDDTWLNEFSRRFVAALPKRVTDENGYPITVTVNQAEYGGFSRRMVEVFKKRSKTFHVMFTGMLISETEIPLISDVEITPKYREATNEKED